MNDNRGNLDSDNQGFLIGIHRIDQNIVQIQRDIKKILSIVQGTTSFTHVSDAQVRAPFLPRTNAPRKSADVAEKVIDIVQDLYDDLEDSQKSNENNHTHEEVDLSDQDNTTQQDTNTPGNRGPVERDSKGRFVGKNGSNNDENTAKSTNDYVKSILGKINGGIHSVTGAIPNTQGIDPTLDALQEVNDNLGPVKRVAGTILRPIKGLKNLIKKSEPIPREQKKHNNRVLSYLNQISKGVGNNLSLVGFMRVIPVLAIALGGAVTAGLISWWRGGGFSGVRGGTVNGNNASAGLARINPTQDQKSTIKDSYDSAIKAGFTHDQAIALVGENGRENDFNQNLMFGSHNDPARGRNLGIFSWQGGRRDGLIKYLSSKGLMNADGTIKRSKEALTAQYEYARMEMESNPRWKQTFLDKKNITNDDARAALGGKGSYVGWARGQDSIRRADGSRIPFDWKKQEAKANSYSKTANELTNLNSENDDQITKNQVIPKGPRTKNPIANRIQQEARDAVTSNNVSNTTSNASPTAAASRNSFYVGVSKLPTQNTVPNLLNSKSAKPVVVQNNANDTNINQNVGDINLANVFTGGIGMDQKLKK